LKTEEFENKLTQLNLSIDQLSRRINYSSDVINTWNDNLNPIPNSVINFLISYEYQIKFQQLQREFLAIKRANKWKFETYHQAMYDFVMKEQKHTEFKVKDYTIIIRIGNKDFGFKHLLLRHFGNGVTGSITALDILKIGNVIKNDVTLPAKDNKRIVFIQNKNNTKYTAVLQKEKSGKLLFSFFSDK
jgi:hypothetical protein